MVGLSSHCGNRNGHASPMNEILDLIRAWDHEVLAILNRALASQYSACLFSVKINRTAELLISCVMIMLWFYEPTRSSHKDSGVRSSRTKVLVYIVALAPAYMVTRFAAEQIVARPRPLVLADLKKPACLSPDEWTSNIATASHMSSFPSDHAVLISLLTIVLSSIHPRLGAASAAYLFLYSACRIGQGLHWPTDMIGGAVLGALIGWLVLWIETRLAPPFAASALYLERHATWTYTAGFLFLHEFSNGFQSLRGIVHGLLHFRLFH
jgi:membrane-associated phospholipid phosphatase